MILLDAEFFLIGLLGTIAIYIILFSKKESKHLSITMKDIKSMRNENQRSDIKSKLEESQIEKTEELESQSKLEPVKQEAQQSLQERLKLKKIS